MAWGFFIENSDESGGENIVKHLTAMNELSIEDIFGLIKEAEDLKKAKLITHFPEGLPPTCSLSRVRGHASALKSQKKTRDECFES